MPAVPNTPHRCGTPPQVTTLIIHLRIHLIAKYPPAAKILLLPASGLPMCSKSAKCWSTDERLLLCRDLKASIQAAHDSTSTMTPACAAWLRKPALVVVKVSLWVVLLLWLAIWLLRLVAQEWKPLSARLTQRTNWRAVYGDSATYFLLFDAPVFAIVVLAALYLELQPSPGSWTRPELLGWTRAGCRQLRVRLWTYPVLVHGPLGIVTAAELVGLLLSFIVLFVTIAFHWKYEFEGVAPRNDRKTWQTRLDSAGHKTGHAALVPMAFLFFPVTRGSVLLRLINIPFDQAVKYHKWLAHSMLLLVLVHSFLCAAYMYTVKHDLWGLMGKWNRDGQFNNLAGCIATGAGALMWLTSLPQFRRRIYEMFFLAHHLYIVFVVFTAIHVGEKMFDLVLAAVFLFVLDRFLRFLQSRKVVSLVSCRSFPGETVELVLAKHPGLQYSAGSFIFVQVPAISWWQWHPFTIASSSSADPDHVSIIVKAVKRKGAWTYGLRQLVRERAGLECQEALTSFNLLRVSVEGPYGNDSAHFLKYQNLIMVAGGSGITPFIAALKDILHRHHNKQPFLPADVTLIWAVRKSDELHVLTDTLMLPPHHEQGLSLNLQAFVTDQDRTESSFAQHDLLFPETSALRFESPLPKAVGRDSNWAVITTVLASLVTYLCIWGLFEHYSTGPLHQGISKRYPVWASTLFRLFAMVIAISLVGIGTVLLPELCEDTRCWLLGPKKASSFAEKSTESVPIVNMLEKPVINIHYGHRPDLEGMFNEAAKRLAGTDVGVMVCGPFEMQQNVARQCRKHSSLLGSSVAFHFHSDTFQL